MARRARLLCAVLGAGLVLAALDLWSHPERWERLPFERGPPRLNAAIDALTALALLLAAAGVPWPALAHRLPARFRRVVGRGMSG